ncbi:hypothetical protein San01_61170 [Streptomyces angustmyceticus]|uniref:Uncharacterized protein n=1 Tax=Streptomyces angustmyceticus TaxID=285578 RepID=A0A5J4LQ53_9ACTN|nr:hypothetical protein San01_61170 [Streptomyces angustmyceticus]
MSKELSSISRQPSTSGPSAADNTRPAVSIGLAFAICLVAANLRTRLTGVGTLLPAIEHGSDLTSSWGGLLSTPPADVQRDAASGGPDLSPVRHRTPARGSPWRADRRNCGPVRLPL